MSSFLELAKTRRSVRTFDGTKPDQSIITELQTYIENRTNPYGIKFRFVFLDAEENKLSSPVLAGEKLFVTAVMKKNENADAAYGYAFEDLLMHAHGLGLGTVWIGGTMPREKFEQASALAEDEAMPCVSPLGIVARKMSVKESLMRKGVKADERFDFKDLFFIGDFDRCLSEEYAKEHGLYEALEAVRLAPSAVNKQPWRIVIDGNKAHFYEKKDKGFVTPDYDLQKIDVGIALYHFESQLISEGRAPEFSVKDPGLNMPENTEYIGTYSF